ncbi:hypothetical protein [Mucilaginibacter ginsenosidivorans]|uniref:Uncharacterized protein n=1 Tax=Mucilaginibacter ginsenosidivorans TaxID=398053 RepID=A0A5B8V168_9SPHI|nr:hypothetical protein [Mucilaginibacter ginsenosidivorans]QEC64381.1 hypothetical protein FRZ54_17960 [Mucilaginibacter ginsenosidivorans]
MKHLEKTKFLLSIILIFWGLFLGIKMLSFNVGNVFFNTAFAIGYQTLPVVATYTPIYAGICIISGIYLITKVKAE